MGNTENAENVEEIVEERHSIGGGFLSKGQIEYLLTGCPELSNNAIKQRRRKIRNNYQAAIVDLALLSEVGHKDQSEIFAPLIDPEGDVESRLYEWGILTEQELEHFDIGDTQEDEELEALLAVQMIKGVRDLMATLALLIGPEDFLQEAERAVNSARIQHSLITETERDLFDLTAQRVPFSSEKISEYNNLR